MTAPKTDARPAPRWRRLPRERPREILRAAAAVFARDGLHGATLDSVAREAGITKGTIYLYFRDKDDLFLAALKERSARVFDSAKALAEAEPRRSFREQAAFLVREICRSIHSPEALSTLRMVLAEADRFPGTARRFYREIILQNNRRLAAFLARAMERGEARRLDALVAARCLIGMLLVFALSQKVLGGERILPISKRRIVDTAAAVFLDGIAAGRRPRRRNGP